MKLGALGLGLMFGGILALPIMRYMSIPIPFITIPLGIILFITDERIYRYLASKVRQDE